MKVILIGLAVVGIIILGYVGFIIISALLHSVHTSFLIARDYIGERGVLSYVLLVCAFGCWFLQWYVLLPNIKAIGRVIAHFDRSYLNDMVFTYRTFIPICSMVVFVIISDIVGIIYKRRHRAEEWYEEDDSDDVTYLADYAAQHSNEIFSEPIEDTISEDLQETLRVMYKQKWEKDDVVANSQGFLIQ